jgi:hypothetical protein
MQKASAVFEQDKAESNSTAAKSANRTSAKSTRRSSSHPGVQP